MGIVMPCPVPGGRDGKRGGSWRLGSARLRGAKGEPRGPFISGGKPGGSFAAGRGRSCRGGDIDVDGCCGMIGV